MGKSTEFDSGSAVSDLLRYLTVEGGDNSGRCWIGQSPEWQGEYLFGGFVVAQALIAATREVSVGSRVHSLHAYFLRPAKTDERSSYEIDDLRCGRSFTTRRICAAQEDGRPILEMYCSLTADTDGYIYDLAPSEPVAPPDELEEEEGPGPWVACYLGPTPATEDGTRQSTHRMWCRIPTRLPDDPHLHTALIGFATDWTGVGGRPLNLDADTEGMISLDHAAWFHRAARADEWLYYDVHSLVNAGGRGLVRGVMRDQQSRVIASVAQEMRLFPV